MLVCVGSTHNSPCHCEAMCLWSIRGKRPIKVLLWFTEQLKPNRWSQLRWRTCTDTLRCSCRPASHTYELQEKGHWNRGGWMGTMPGSEPASYAFVTAAFTPDALSTLVVWQLEIKKLNSVVCVDLLQGLISPFRSHAHLVCTVSECAQ